MYAIAASATTMIPPTLSVLTPSLVLFESIDFCIKFIEKTSFGEISNKILSCMYEVKKLYAYF
jgi:hypothetical protein